MSVSHLGMYTQQSKSGWTAVLVLKKSVPAEPSWPIVIQEEKCADQL